jgi:TRAP-type C4-dicarboxylate transport system permease small subunit
VGGAIVGLILAWKGALITIDYFRRGVIAMDILNTPQYLLMAIIPVGGFLLMIEFILRIFHFGQTGSQEDGST